MAIVPITYIEFIIWLILILIQSEKVEITLIIRTIASPYGFLAGIDCLAGERWLFISSTGTATMVQFDDGMALFVSFFLIIGSFVMAYFTTKAWSAFRSGKYATS